MQEKPKKKPKSEIGEVEEFKKGSWSDDQREHEYYYDDAHGYEVYEPGGDENDDAEPDKADANRSK